LAYEPIARPIAGITARGGPLDHHHLIACVIVHRGDHPPERGSCTDPPDA
jgi:hypothetical protein